MAPPVLFLWNKRSAAAERIAFQARRCTGHPEKHLPIIAVTARTIDSACTPLTAPSPLDSNETRFKGSA